MRMAMYGGLYADPWWTIHFRGQANHVATSHIPLRSNFNHIFITRITSNHIILTYPLQGTSDQKYFNCHVQICIMCSNSRILLGFIRLLTGKRHWWRCLHSHTRGTPENTKKISPGKCFLYLCVLRFSAWPGLVRGWTTTCRKISDIREWDINLVFLMEIISSKSFDELETNTTSVPTEEI